MALSPAIAKIGNRKPPVLQHWGFLSCYMEALASFLPTGIIAYVNLVFNMQIEKI